MEIQQQHQNQNDQEQQQMEGNFQQKKYPQKGDSLVPIIHKQKNLDQQDELQHKTLNHNSLYYSFMQRYFTNYVTDDQRQFLHIHSNGLCLISVNPKMFESPPILLKNFMEINLVKGKKKKGGIRTSKNTIIVRIVCQNNTQIEVKALIQGTILQKNQKLTIQMLGKPQGYIMVILPAKKIHPQRMNLKKITPNHEEK